MPRRDDISTILILGSGPIIIGQACEFDYSGTQACKALREDGYRIVLVNSNPATIMTDPEFSDRTYIEPITLEAVTKIIAKEKANGTPIDALLPTLGGQIALNTACALYDDGTLAKFGIEMIGATREAIDRAENREKFIAVIKSIGLRLPRALTVTNLDEAWRFLDEIGLPVILRPAFTMGGAGGGIAYNRDEFEDLVQRGIDASMIGQIEIDQSVIGWKEFELEVVRDRKDNCVIVCGIENIDAMGVHTGDSITVAPIQTLTDKEYQRMRDAAIAIMRAIGVDTGGSNVQFAVNPRDGEMVVVEMNPRVSRSSALASKATGFPIARIAAKLAVGYTLDELRNDVTGTTSACFEPSIDYVVTKMPRWTFEKFPEADETLTTQMKSVGEAMSIGRTFKESLQKAIRSMEVKRFGLGLDRNDHWLLAKRAAARVGPTESDPLVAADGSRVVWPIPEETLMRKLSVPSQGRLYFVRYAMKMGWSIDRIAALTHIDPWFLDQIQQLVEFEDELFLYERLDDLPRDVLFKAKQLGYSDPQLAYVYLDGISTDTILQVRDHRKRLKIEPVYKLVDTCAAEFEALTPYYYSTYETPYIAPGLPGVVCEDEIRVTDRRKIIILGGGPNRIGQGIEFDYCCCQAAFACREMGFESVMINSNPETVSTDYDTSDLLFFEPLTLEDTLNVVERLNGGGIDVPDRSGKVAGCIVQFGGQTPLNLAHGLVAAGVPLIGTALDSIDLAEDRDRFKVMLEELGMTQPYNGIAYSLDEAVSVATRIGYPVLVRPSYVLGGRGMETCFDEVSLRRYMRTAVDVSDLADAPVLIDRFLSEAIEVDVDVVGDFGEGTEARRHEGTEGSEYEPRALICGVMEHIEEAGIHSGDSACTIPPYSLRPVVVDQIKDIARRLAERLKVRGLMNVQMAVKNDEVYILEVNPRASRTVPFVSKAKGQSWARVAAKVMMGASLTELGVKEIPDAGFFSVKESVFPFARFPGVDVILGPEMRSTGEVMGMDRSLHIALAKAQMGAGIELPTQGNVFLSVRDSDKSHCVQFTRTLVSLGFTVFTTKGTHELLHEYSVDTVLLRKISEGARPNILDKIANREIHLIINTPTRKGAHTDEGKIRATAVRAGVPMITTITGANAVVKAIVALRAGAWSVAALQDYFPSHEPGRSQDALDIQTVQAQAGSAQEAAKNR
ncbi:MAG: carbamoyl-phosphate synthase large subunit [Planctomycetes bacterium]|nr:carbamoyl-phosphate synthase large subunit [Planctomycetota bacterium]